MPLLRYPEITGLRVSSDLTGSLAWVAARVMPEWMGRGACGSTNPETFFPSRGSGRGAERRIAAASAAAKAVCGQCTVRAECLQFALDNDCRYGVWGGLDEYELAALRSRPVQR